MNEINRLLGKARGLALDSANVGVNDSNALAANQAEVTNTLNTITNIAQTTQFGAKKLLDGSTQSIEFQIGPNAAQTATVSFQSVQAKDLGVNLEGNRFASLAEIDISDPTKAQDALKVIDKAIADITNFRGALGAFQTNTLEANANNLRTTLANTTAAESTIRDTDFAVETANFTKNQVLLQAGTTVPPNANQISQLVLGLLRG